MDNHIQEAIRNAPWRRPAVSAPLNSPTSQPTTFGPTVSSIRSEPPFSTRLLAGANPTAQITRAGALARVGLEQVFMNIDVVHLMWRGVPESIEPTLREDQLLMKLRRTQMHMFATIHQVISGALLLPLPALVTAAWLITTDLHDAASIWYLFAGVMQPATRDQCSTASVIRSSNAASSGLRMMWHRPGVEEDIMRQLALEQDIMHPHRGSRRDHPYEAAVASSTLAMSAEQMADALTGGMPSIDRESELPPNSGEPTVLYFTWARPELHDRLTTTALALYGLTLGAVTIDAVMEADAETAGGVSIQELNDLVHDSDARHQATLGLLNTPTNRSRWAEGLANQTEALMVVATSLIIPAARQLQQVPNEQIDGATLGIPPRVSVNSEASMLGSALLSHMAILSNSMTVLTAERHNPASLTRRSLLEHQHTYIPLHGAALLVYGRTDAERYFALTTLRVVATRLSFNDVLDTDAASGSMSYRHRQESVDTQSAHSSEDAPASCTSHSEVVPGSGMTISVTARSMGQRMLDSRPSPDATELSMVGLAQALAPFTIEEMTRIVGGLPITVNTLGPAHQDSETRDQVVASLERAVWHTEQICPPDADIALSELRDSLATCQQLRLYATADVARLEVPIQMALHMTLQSRRTRSFYMAFALRRSIAPLVSAYQQAELTTPHYISSPLTVSEQDTPEMTSVITRWNQLFGSRIAVMESQHLGGRNSAALRTALRVKGDFCEAGFCDPAVPVDGDDTTWSYQPGEVLKMTMETIFLMQADFLEREFTEMVRNGIIEEQGYVAEDAVIELDRNDRRRIEFMRSFGGLHPVLGSYRPDASKWAADYTLIIFEVTGTSVGSVIETISYHRTRLQLQEICSPMNVTVSVCPIMCSGNVETWPLAMARRSSFLGCGDRGLTAAVSRIMQRMGAIVGRLRTLCPTWTEGHIQSTLGRRMATATPHTDFRSTVVSDDQMRETYQLKCAPHLSGSSEIIYDMLRAEHSMAYMKDENMTEFELETLHQLGLLVERTYPNDESFQDAVTQTGGGVSHTSLNTVRELAAKFLSWSASPSEVVAPSQTMWPTKLPGDTQSALMAERLEPPVDRHGYFLSRTDSDTSGGISDVDGNQSQTSPTTSAVGVPDREIIGVATKHWLTFGAVVKPMPERRDVAQSISESDTAQASKSLHLAFQTFLYRQVSLESHQERLGTKAFNKIKKTLSMACGIFITSPSAGGNALTMMREDASRLAPLLPIVLDHQQRRVAVPNTIRRQLPKSAVKPLSTRASLLRCDSDQEYRRFLPEFTTLFADPATRESSKSREVFAILQAWWDSEYMVGLVRQLLELTGICASLLGDTAVVAAHTKQFRNMTRLDRTAYIRSRIHGSSEHNAYITEKLKLVDPSTQRLGTDDYHHYGELLRDWAVPDESLDLNALHQMMQMGDDITQLLINEQDQPTCVHHLAYNVKVDLIRHLMKTPLLMSCQFSSLVEAAILEAINGFNIFVDFAHHQIGTTQYYVIMTSCGDKDFGGGAMVCIADMGVDTADGNEEPFAHFHNIHSIGFRQHMYDRWASRNSQSHQDNGVHSDSADSGDDDGGSCGAEETQGANPSPHLGMTEGLAEHHRMLLAPDSIEEPWLATRLFGRRCCLGPPRFVDYRVISRLESAPSTCCTIAAVVVSHHPTCMRDAALDLAATSQMWSEKLSYFVIPYLMDKKLMMALLQGTRYVQYLAESDLAFGSAVYDKVMEVPRHPFSVFVLIEWGRNIVQNACDSRVMHNKLALAAVQANRNRFQLESAPAPKFSVRQMWGNGHSLTLEAYWDNVYAVSLSDIAITNFGHALIATTIKNRVSNIKHLAQIYHPDPWVYCATVGYYEPARFPPLFGETLAPTGEEVTGIETDFSRAIDAIRTCRTREAADTFEMCPRQNARVALTAMFHPSINLADVWVVKSIGHKLAVRSGGGVERLHEAMRKSRLHHSVSEIMRVSSVVVDAPLTTTTETVNEVRRTALRTEVPHNARYNFERGSVVIQPNRRVQNREARQSSKLIGVSGLWLDVETAILHDTLQPHLRWITENSAPTESAASNAVTATELSRRDMHDADQLVFPRSEEDAVLVGLLDLRTSSFDFSSRRRDTAQLWHMLKTWVNSGRVEGVVILRGDEVVAFRWPGREVRQAPAATLFTLLDVLAQWLQSAVTPCFTSTMTNARTSLFTEADINRFLQIRTIAFDHVRQLSRRYASSPNAWMAPAANVAALLADAPWLASPTSISFLEALSIYPLEHSEAESRWLLRGLAVCYVIPEMQRNAVLIRDGSQCIAHCYVDMMGAVNLARRGGSDTESTMQEWGDQVYRMIRDGYTGSVYLDVPNGAAPSAYRPGRARLGFTRDVKLLFMLQQLIAGLLSGEWHRHTQCGAAYEAAVSIITFAYGIAIKEQHGTWRDLPIQFYLAAYFNHFQERTAELTNRTMNSDELTELTANPKRVKPAGLSMVQEVITAAIGGHAAMLGKEDHSEWGPGKHPLSFAIGTNIRRGAYGNGCANWMNLGAAGIASKINEIPRPAGTAISKNTTGIYNGQKTRWEQLAVRQMANALGSEPPKLGIFTENDMGQGMEHIKSGEEGMGSQAFTIFFASCTGCFRYPLSEGRYCSAFGVMARKLSEICSIDYPSKEEQPPFQPPSGAQYGVTGQLGSLMESRTAECCNLLTGSLPGLTLRVQPADEIVMRAIQGSDDCSTSMIVNSTAVPALTADQVPRMPLLGQNRASTMATIPEGVQVDISPNPVIMADATSLPPGQRRNHNRATTYYRRATGAVRFDSASRASGSATVARPNMGARSPMSEEPSQQSGSQRAGVLQPADGAPGNAAAGRDFPPNRSLSLPIGSDPGRGRGRQSGRSLSGAAVSESASVDVVDGVDVSVQNSLLLENLDSNTLTDFPGTWSPNHPGIPHFESLLSMANWMVLIVKMFTGKRSPKSAYHRMDMEIYSLFIAFFNAIQIAMRVCAPAARVKLGLTPHEGIDSAFGEAANVMREIGHMLPAMTALHSRLNATTRSWRCRTNMCRAYGVPTDVTPWMRFSCVSHGGVPNFSWSDVYLHSPAALDGNNSAQFLNDLYHTAATALGSSYASALEAVELSSRRHEMYNLMQVAINQYCRFPTECAQTAEQEDATEPSRVLEYHPQNLRATGLEIIKASHICNMFMRYMPTDVTESDDTQEPALGGQDRPGDVYGKGQCFRFRGGFNTRLGKVYRARSIRDSLQSATESLAPGVSGMTAVFARYCDQTTTLGVAEKGKQILSSSGINRSLLNVNKILMRRTQQRAKHGRCFQLTSPSRAASLLVQAAESEGLLDTTMDFGRRLDLVEMSQVCTVCGYIMMQYPMDAVARHCLGELIAGKVVVPVSEDHPAPDVQAGVLSLNSVTSHFRRIAHQCSNYMRWAEYQPRTANNTASKNSPPTVHGSLPCAPAREPLRNRLVHIVMVLHCRQALLQLKQNPAYPAELHGETLLLMTMFSFLSTSPTLSLSSFQNKSGLSDANYHMMFRFMADVLADLAAQAGNVILFASTDQNSTKRLASHVRYCFIPATEVTYDPLGEPDIRSRTVVGRSSRVEGLVTRCAAVCHIINLACKILLPASVIRTLRDVVGTCVRFSDSDMSVPNFLQDDATIMAMRSTHSPADQRNHAATWLWLFDNPRLMSQPSAWRASIRIVVNSVRSVRAVPLGSTTNHSILLTGWLVIHTFENTTAGVLREESGALHHLVNISADRLDAALILLCLRMSWKELSVLPPMAVAALTSILPTDSCFAVCDQRSSRTPSNAAPARQLYTVDHLTLSIGDPPLGSYVLKNVYLLASRWPGSAAHGVSVPRALVCHPNSASIRLELEVEIQHAVPNRSDRAATLHETVLSAVLQNAGLQHEQYRSYRTALHAHRAVLNAANRSCAHTWARDVNLTALNNHIPLYCSLVYLLAPVQVCQAINLQPSDTRNSLAEYLLAVRHPELVHSAPLAGAVGLACTAVVMNALEAIRVAMGHLGDPLATIAVPAMDLQEEVMEGLDLQSSPAQILAAGMVGANISVVLETLSQHRPEIVARLQQEYAEMASSVLTSELSVDELTAWLQMGGTPLGIRPQNGGERGVSVLTVLQTMRQDMSFGKEALQTYVNLFPLFRFASPTGWGPCRSMFEISGNTMAYACLLQAMGVFTITPYVLSAWTMSLAFRLAVHQLEDEMIRANVTECDDSREHLAVVITRRLEQLLQESALHDLQLALVRSETFQMTYVWRPSSNRAFWASSQPGQTVFTQQNIVAWRGQISTAFSERVVAHRRHPTPRVAEAELQQAATLIRYTEQACTQPDLPLWLGERIAPIEYILEEDSGLI